jgi:hypothetical protein
MSGPAHRSTRGAPGRSLDAARSRAHVDPRAPTLIVRLQTGLRPRAGTGVPGPRSVGVRHRHVTAGATPDGARSSPPRSPERRAPCAGCRRSVRRSCRGGSRRSAPPWEHRTRHASVPTPRQRPARAPGEDAHPVPADGPHGTAPRGDRLHIRRRTGAPPRRGRRADAIAARRGSPRPGGGHRRRGAPRGLRGGPCGRPGGGVRAGRHRRARPCRARPQPARRERAKPPAAVVGGAVHAGHRADGTRRDLGQARETRRGCRRLAPAPGAERRAPEASRAPGPPSTPCAGSAGSCASPRREGAPRPCADAATGLAPRPGSRSSTSLSSRPLASTGSRRRRRAPTPRCCALRRAHPGRGRRARGPPG